MAPQDRWQAIEELFNEAVARPPEERASFLADACAGDPVLLADVRRLLDSDARQQRLTGLAAAVASDWLTDGGGDLTGREVGPFQVLSSLAKGGMGHVYLARDASLERQVAIKVLPLAFARDPERVRRFENEARIIATLNHPNIVTILQIGHIDDRLYLATEFVEGETLRARIARGPVPLDAALQLGDQVAAALVAAHGAGIVHRDLKPENVMVRPDGYVKVLDFGLARQRQTAIELSVATLTGAVMGTVDYMSPEQALGQEVDHRTDIFGTGVLLYELITGQVPFRGRTDADTRERLARACGSSEAGRATVDLVLRALAKDPDQRFASAAALRDAIAEASALVIKRPSAQAPERPRWRAAVVAVLVVGAVVVAGLAATRFRPAPPAPDAWALGVDEPLTDVRGAETWPSVSRDGQTVVYAGIGPGGDLDLFRLSQANRTPELLTPNSPAYDSQPALSPDGTQVAFRSDRDGGGIFILDLNGGAVRRVSDLGYNPAWSPDGLTLAVSGVSMDRPEMVYLLSELWVIDLASGGRRAIATRDAVQPSWSPSGRLIAFASLPDGGRFGRDIWVVPAAGGDAVRVTSDDAQEWGPVWSGDGGSIFYCSGQGGTTNVWRIAVDPATGAPAGSAAPMGLPTRYACPLSVAADGSRLVYASRSTHSAIARASFDPVRGELAGPPDILTSASRGAGPADVSPDGARIVFHSEGDRDEDIFVMNLDGSGVVNLTHDPASDRIPRWAPDGTRIAFHSDRTGKSEIWTMAPDGSELRQLSTGPAGVNVNMVNYAPRGGRMSVHEGQDTYIIDPRLPYTGQAKDVLPRYSFTGYRFSPDLRVLWGWQRLAGGPYPDGIVRYDIGAREYTALTDIGTNPFPMQDGRRVLFTHISDLYMLDTATRAVRKLDTHGLGVTNAVLTPDERTVVLTVRVDESDLWQRTPPAPASR